MFSKRQIIILAAFCLPLFALIALSYVETPHAGLPKKLENKALAGNKPAPKSPDSLLQERKRIKTLLDEARAMSPEQYLERQKTDPTFLAPDIEVRRERLSHRLAQLENMSAAEWAVDGQHPRDNAATSAATKN